MTDNAGNEGSTSNSFAITIDVTPPSAINNDSLDLIDDFGPLQGSIQSGDSTDDRTPTYSGAAGSVDADDVATINIYNKDAFGDIHLIGSTTVNADGSWTFDPNPPLTPGDYIFTARPVDKAGNEGPATTEWNFTVVGAAPADPAITSVGDNQAPVTGNLQQNGVTDDTPPVVRGTGTAGSTITIYVTGPHGESFTGGTTTVGSNGVWTLEINPAFDKGDGQYVIQAQASDIAGQLSNITGGYPIVLDTSAPATPSLPTITDNVGDVIGALAPNGTTDDSRPVISGQEDASEAGGTITIKDGDTVLGTTTINPDGSWSFTPPALSEGDHTITITVTDQARNESNPSDGFDIHVDTSNVVVSFDHFVDNVDPITGNIDNGGISNDRTPQMVGKATANAVVTVSYVDSNGTKIIVGTTSADSTGAWSLTPSTDLIDGNYGFMAEAVNAAGTKGNAYFIINIDGTAPAAPVINDVLDDVGFIQGAITSGSSTDDTTPTFTGSGEVGATITIKDEDGNVVGQTTVAGDGTWSITTNPLAEGNHSLTVTATDQAGNESSGVGFDVTIDTTAPTSTAILQSISDDSGFNTADFVTNDPTLIYTISINGTLETGDTVWMRIRSEDGSVGEWIKAVDNGDGTYSIDHNDAAHSLADGNYVIETIVRDAAGNSSAISSQIIIIDTTAPNDATVTISGYFDNVGAITGNITQSGSSSDDKTPLLKGTIAGLETGDRVIIKVTGSDGITKILGEATVSAGTWQYQVSDAQAFLDGDYTFEAVVTDNAGNEGSKSNSFELNIDTVAPSAIDTTKLDLVDDFGPVQGTINRGDSTDDHTPTYKGAAGSVDPADASKINIYNKGSDGTLTLIGSTTVNADGSWSFDPQTALTAGDYIFVARPVDKAGNEGDATPDWNFTVVGAAPSIPVISRIVDNVGDVTGDLQRNEVTDDTTPTLHGTGSVGSTITIHVTAPDGSTFIGGTTVVAADGSWTLEINPAFAKGDGTYTIAAQASDAAGQLSGMTTGYPIELDTTAPSTPSLPTITDNVGETTGVLAPNDTTDDKRPVISGNAGVGEAGGIVTIKDGDTVLGTTTINADGSWSYTPPALSEGSHSISVTITDSAGNTSNASDSFDLIVDTTEVVVSFDHFVDSVGSITGNVATGGISDDQKPVFNGNATPNATVTVSYVNSDGQTVIVGTTTANSDGTWTLTPTENLADGSYSFTAEAKNAAGNTITTTFTLEVDATAPQTPALPVATDNAEPNIGVITSGSDTNDKRPQFSGTGEVGSTITIKDGDTVLGTTTVDSDGNWSFMPDTPLSEGSHSITVTETDTAGNASNPSPSLDFNVDTTAPATPAVPTANDNTEPKTGVITAGSSTNETKPVFSGTGEVGSTITIKDGDSVIGTTTVDSDGNWSLTPSTALSEGNHSITVTETDKARNASEESAALDFTVDTTAPATPAVPTATDNTEPNTGVITAGSSTNETQPEFSGTGEVGSIITIKDGDTIIGETTVDSDGNWSLTPNTPLSEGDHSITVTATDAAGNASDSSASLDLNIDTTAPNAIDESKLDLVDDFGTIQGTINRGDPTDDRTPTYDGAAGSVDPDDASTINIYNKDAEGNVTLIGTTTVNADGSWSFDPSPQLIPGDYILSARPVDKAGNIGPATTDWNFTVVGAAPSDPAITSVSDNEGAVTGGLQQNGVTDDTTPVVGGTGTAGSTITIHVTAPDGTSFIGGTTVVDSNGNWTLEISPAFAKGDGTYTIKAQANDAAGQLSNMTGGYPIVLDTTAPSTPSMPTITDNVGDVTGALSPHDTTDDKQPVLSGNAGVGEAGGVVTIKDGDTVLGTTTINADGSWSYSPSALADGDHSISITVTDPAGNTSAASPSFDFTVDSSNVIVGFDHFVDDFGSIQGNVGNNGVSDDRRPQMVGSTSANATVTVSYVNSDGQTVVVGVTTADSNGVWTLTPITDLADGVYSFTANAENAAGTKGSVIFGIEIDGTAPAAPVIDEVRDDVGFIQGAITSGSSTDDTTPTFSGSGEVGATITIKDSDGNVVGTTTVGSDGKWSVTTDPLTEGDHSLTVTATDAAGNESTGTGFDVTIDTQGPTTTATLQSISEDTGFDTGDFITSDNSLIYTIAINGSLEAGDTVWLRIKPASGSAGDWIQATRNDDGTYSVNHNDASHALSDGRYIIETIVRDAAGNPSTSTSHDITIDTQGPTSATISITGFADNVGLIQGDMTTSGTSTDDTTPLLKGTVTGLEDGDRIVIKVTGADGVKTVLGYATVTDGTWEYQVTDAQALAEGDYSFEAVVTDNAGNEGTISASFDINLNLTGPSASSSITSISDDTGTSATDFITNDDTLIINGTVSETLATGEKVQIQIDNRTWVDAVYDADTNTWTYDNTGSVLSEGAHTITSRVIDAAGNVTVGSSQNVIIDKTAPIDGYEIAISGFTDNVGLIQGEMTVSGTSSDDTTPLLKGTVTGMQDGDRIAVKVTAPDGQKILLGYATVTGNTWTYQVSDAQAFVTDGQYSFEAVVTDNVGNEGKTSTVFDINLDLTAPTSAATITGITTDTGFSDSDFITSDTTLTIHGSVSQTLASDEKVQISIDGGDWVDAVYNSADNTWSYDNTGNALSEGSHSIATRVIDAAGNVTNGGSQTVVIDTTAPTSASVSITGFYDDIGLNTGDVTTSNSYTDDTKPLLKGTIAGVGDGERVVIKVTDENGVTSVLGVATISDGTWEYQVTDAQAFSDGKYSFEAVVTDTAGNEGTKSSAFDINVDTAAPTATSDIVSITEDTGNVGDDFITRDGTLIITAKVTGTLGANERVQISLDNGQTWQDATYAASSDSWSLDNSDTELADGTYTFKTRVIDAAGNLGTESSKEVTINNGVPSTTVSITHFSDDYGTQLYDSLPSGSYTDDTTPTLHGTLSKELEAGATVAVYRGSVFVGYATVSGTSWSFTEPTELKDGTFYTYYAAVQSLSGVNGSLSSGFEIAIDTTDSNMAPNVGTGGAYATYSMSLRLGNNGGWTMMTDMAEYSADGNDFRNFGSPKLLTWANVGNAAVSDQYTWEKLFSSYTYGDYNRDGYMDMFLTDRTYTAGLAGSGTGTMFVGKSDGTYEATLVQVNSLTHFGSTVSFDMDGDGWLDVVLSDSGNDSSTFLHNKRAGRS